MNTVSAHPGCPNRTRPRQLTTRRRIIGSVDDPREPRTSGPRPELPPGVGDQLRHLDGDAAAPPFGVARDEARITRFPRSVSPLPNGLTVQAEPLCRRFDPVDSGVLENR